MERNRWQIGIFTIHKVRNTVQKRRKKKNNYKNWVRQLMKD